MSLFLLSLLSSLWTPQRSSSCLTSGEHFSGFPMLVMNLIPQWWRNNGDLSPPISKQSEVNRCHQRKEKTNPASLSSLLTAAHSCYSAQHLFTLISALISSRCLYFSVAPLPSLPCSLASFQITSSTVWGVSGGELRGSKWRGIISFHLRLKKMMKREKGTDTAKRQNMRNWKKSMGLSKSYQSWSWTSSLIERSFLTF